MKIQIEVDQDQLKALWDIYDAMDILGSIGEPQNQLKEVIYQIKEAFDK